MFAVGGGYSEWGKERMALFADFLIRCSVEADGVNEAD